MHWINPHVACRLAAEFLPFMGREIEGLGTRRRLSAWAWWRFCAYSGMAGGEISRLLPLAAEEFGNRDIALALGADVAFANPEVFTLGSFVTSIRRESGRLRPAGPFGVTLGVGGVYAEVVEHPVQSAAELARYRLPAVNRAHFDAIHRERQRLPDACLFWERVSLQQALCDYILGTEAFM